MLRQVVPITVFLWMLLNATHVVSAQNSNWQGQWITDLGIMNLTQSGNTVSGSYDGNGTIQASVSGHKLTGTYRRGNNSGQVSLEMAADRLAFSGEWSTQNGSGKWRGWRSDNSGSSDETADFSGVWLSSWGTLQLQQEGARVTGRYGAEGWSFLEGTVTGKRLKLTWRRNQWSGQAWLEVTADGQRLFGASEGNDPTAWLGLKLEGFEKHATPSAGQIVQGRADNGMLYYLRLPDTWQPGQPVDVIVLLHGSNWTTAGMTGVTARQWPELAQRFAILGIQGQNWASWSELDDLRFNYTYVNWMGRSTYQGYPFTDRESPYLVMQVIDELGQLYDFQRTFVGGHSQGAYLTYVLHMHFPDKLNGTFPMAGGLIIQAEPDVFEDAQLMASQRETPMVIVHGRDDNVVEFSSSEYAYYQFLDHGFQNVKLLSPRTSHAFDFLPVGEAVQWLDVMTTEDRDVLVAFAKTQVERKNWRDVGAAIDRALELQAGEEFSPIWQAYQAAAKKDADKHLRALKANRDGKWVDDYLAWEEQFGRSQAAQELNELFAELRKEHADDAKRLMQEARQAFQSGNQTMGWAKYQEIANRYYASPEYRSVRLWLKNR